MERVFEKSCIHLHSCGSDQVRRSLETGRAMDQEVGWLLGRRCFCFHTATSSSDFKVRRDLQYVKT